MIQSTTLYKANPEVMMDSNHLNLIYSLIICHKPKSILEIGIGTGAVTAQIIRANQYNNISAHLTCVDNFYDWSGTPPQEYWDMKKQIEFIVSDEQTFVANCATTYDFIISDADHHRTDCWIDKTLNLLSHNGILIYHDVTNAQFPNLYTIVQYVQNNNINHILFNKNSLESERCDRGLLVIYK